MTLNRVFILTALPLLAACQDISTAGGSVPSPFIAEVPESILEIAAPGQNLNALLIDPVDGCYTYQHVGPVENTMLPLSASNGRPICTRVDA